MDGLIVEFGGRIANTAGDSVLAEFPSAVDAVQCAVVVQDKLGGARTRARLRIAAFNSGSGSTLAMWRFVAETSWATA